MSRIRRVIRRGNANAAIAITAGFAVVVALWCLQVLGHVPPAGFAVALLVCAALVYLASGMIEDDYDQIAARRAAIAAAHARVVAHELPFACSEEQFEAIVDELLARLPAWIADALDAGNVAITVADEDPERPFTLGLYRLDRGAVQVILYRQPLIRVAGNRERLPAAISDTLLHELGHVFGMDEHDLDRYRIGNHPAADAAEVRRLATE
jgi:predicted Zn-dependent protease with MMP-like domain